MDTQQKLRLKTCTIRAAVQKAYDMMPAQFSALTLCLTARKILNNMTMDGSILRRLRELRESGDCPYKVIDPVDGIYEKDAT